MPKAPVLVAKHFTFLMEVWSSVPKSTVDPGTFMTTREKCPDVPFQERVRHLSGKGILFTTMSGLGRYPLNIPSLSDAFLGTSQRRDRLDFDYDDRRGFRERERDRRDDDYSRRDSGGGASRGRTSRDRYSPEVRYMMWNERFACLKRLT